MKESIKKILLHICCATCAGYVIKKLQESRFNVTAFFYNPNIHPKSEYVRRLVDVKNYCLKNNINFIETGYNLDNWLEKIKGLENEPEGGKRCERCFEIRLSKTAELVENNNFDFFSTTLTISPHKNAEVINKIGKDLSDRFYVVDWKKQNGFKCACEIAKQEGFYKQSYCGCIFSFHHFLNSSGL